MTEQNTPKMTHDEMIDVLKGLVFGTFDRTTAKEREALDMAISALSAPSANVISIDQANAMIKSYVSHYEENKGEWILVSERLPEKFRFVNCTCHSLIDDREDWVVETVYVPQPSISPYSDWGNIPMLNDKKCEVIAWMYREIPEPYKAESEKGGE